MRIVLFILGLMLSVSASAQLSVWTDVGYGFYKQKELSDYLGSLNSKLTVDAKITSDFPAYVYYNGGISYLLDNRFVSGAGVGWGSSGARISYTDYSGSILMDMLVSYTSLSLPVGVIVNPDDKYKVMFEMTPSYVFSKMDFHAKSAVGTDVESSDYHFKSKNIAVQPGASVSRRFNHLGFHVKVAYNVAFKRGNLYLEDDHNAFLIDDANRPVRIDWDGLRLAVGLSWMLGE